MAAHRAHRLVKRFSREGRVLRNAREIRSTADRVCGSMKVMDMGLVRGDASSGTHHVLTAELEIDEQTAGRLAKALKLRRLPDGSFQWRRRFRPTRSVGQIELEREGADKWKLLATYHPEVDPHRITEVADIRGTKVRVDGRVVHVER